MSAPASTHEVTRAAACALSEAYALLAQWGREARDDSVGDRRTMHEAAPSLAGTRDGFEEDDHRAQHTTIDA